DIPPALELPAEQERRYLFNSLRTFLARAASARPAFVVFDDLHWADEPTLLLLEHLAEQLPEMPVLIVGTYRDTEVTPGHPLARTFDALTRPSLARRIRRRRRGRPGLHLRAPRGPRRAAARRAPRRPRRSRTGPAGRPAVGRSRRGPAAVLPRAHPSDPPRRALPTPPPPAPPAGGRDPR